MIENHEELMKQAILLAQQCKPIAGYIPKVGAIVAVHGEVVGSGYRGTGKPGDDDHAEKVAIDSVSQKQQLPDATIYTTLEPCSPNVRSKPSECCTELIARSNCKRVFIGIPRLASQIRAINAEFIRVQQTYGLKILSPKSGETIRTRDKNGAYEVTGTFLNQPASDVFAFTGSGGQRWPQPHALRVTGPNKWAVKVHFGGYGPRTICIVKANPLAQHMINYYRRIVETNIRKEDKAKEYFEQAKLESRGKQILEILSNKYIGINMGALPKGIEVQDQVDVELEQPSATP
jgi:pyrimidine deaminase RibD-like protein